MKYNIGDKVRVRRDFADRSYYMEDKANSWCVTDGMLELRGRVVTINEATPGGYHIEEFCCWWTDEMFEGKVNDKKIVITTDGAETIARLYEGKKVVKSATAKCSPDDKFDFGIGAQLAFERLVETTAKKKDEYYNGKVVCIAPCGGFTVGKVYTFVNGRVTDDDGYGRPITGRKIRKIDEFDGFIPFVE